MTTQTPETDTLGILKELAEKGKTFPIAPYFDDILDEYYSYKGWDVNTSLQKRDKLAELGLEDVADI
ncbi:hypothetical protein LCGC14_2844940, partial [marine sediment metagenome]